MRFSKRTKLVNWHRTASIVVRETKNGFIMDKFNVTIPPLSHAYVYYNDLGVEYNYSQPYVNAFLEGQEDGGQRTVVSTSVVRDNEVIVFGFENEMVTVNPISGKFWARFGLPKWFVSPTSVLDQPHREVGGEDGV